MGYNSLQDLFDNIPDGVSIINKDLRIEWVNKALHNKGFHCSGVKGKKCYFIYKRKNKLCKNCPTVKSFVKGKTIRIQERGEDGKYYEVTSIPVKEKGKVEHVVEIVREIKKAKPFTVSLSQTPGAIVFVLDPQLKFVAANKGTEDLLLFSEGQLAGKKISKFIQESKKDATLKRITKAIKGKQHPSFEIGLVATNGEHFLIDAHLNPFYSEGDLLGIEVVAVNVTDLKKVEKDLKKSEEKYRTFVHNFQGIAYKAHVSGIPIIFDGAVKNITGYSSKDFIKGKVKWDDIILPEDFNKISDSWKTLSSVPNYSIEREYRIKKKDKKIVCVHELVQNVCDESGKPAFVQGTLYDITLSKKAEDELKKSKKKVETYLNLAGTIIVAIDKKGKIIMMNRKGCEVLGWKKSDIEGMDWIDKCIPPRNKKEIKKVFNNVVKGKIKAAEYYENPIVTKKGEERIVRWHNTVLRDDEGNITGTLSSGEDITERVNARKVASETRAKYRVIFELSPEAIILSSKEGVLIEINQWALKWLGYKKDELIGKNIKDLKIFDAKNMKKAMSNISKRVKGKEIEPYELEFITKKGKKKYGRVSGNVIGSEKGKVDAIIYIISDMTDIVKSIEMLKKKCNIE